MITKYQRHPTEADCVILHVTGALAANGPTVIVHSQSYRDTLEAQERLED